MGELIVGLREERFFRLTLTHDGEVLKIEMINDVPSRVGIIQDHPILGRLDRAENILANKIIALLDREEPKDLDDIWGFFHLKGLSLEEATQALRGKPLEYFLPTWRGCFVQRPKPIVKRCDGFILRK